jgi:hypothetical protein
MDTYYGGEYYGEMLKVVYPQVKAANPDAEVLLGGLLLDCDPRNPPVGQTCASSRFLEGILTAGAAGSFDGISFHTYDYYGQSLGNYVNPNWSTSWKKGTPALNAKVSFLKEVMAQFNISDKYLMATEVALICMQNCDDKYEMTKAYNLVESYTAGLALGLRSSIWYDAYGTWRESGLLYENSQPRPAYQAFQFLESLLASSSYRGDVSRDGVRAYEFAKGNQRVWVVWSLDGQSHTLNLSTAPKAVYNVLGASQASSKAVSVGFAPLYLVW